jgi:flagellin
MRELSVQAANDTLTQEDRSYIQLEVDQLKEEITRISTTTQFNKKQLLDGSAAVLWSSDNLDTRAIINGGLRQIDQFGQKMAAEGNYKIEIQANPGQAEVLKTDIFKVKHDNVVFNLVTDPSHGVTDVSVNGVPAGNYVISGSAVAANIGAVAGSYGTHGIETTGTNVINFAAISASYNLNMLIEVTKVEGDNVWLSISTNVTEQDGTVTSYSRSGILFNANTDKFAANALRDLGINTANGAFTLEIDEASVEAGSKLVYNKTSMTGGDYNAAIAAPTGYNTAAAISYNLSVTGGGDLRLRAFYLNSTTGAVYNGDVTLRTNSNFTPDNAKAFKTTFSVANVGDVAGGDVKLRDLDKFWDANGKFLLEDPKTITIVQGDGTKATFTIYSTDTLDDVREKMNNAILDGLNQRRYTSGPFVSYVQNAASNATGLDNINGTFVIRTAVTGAAGRFSFSGDEDVIKALSINVIQEAKENKFEITVSEAHYNRVLTTQEITGNVMYGLVHPNVDVSFDSMANIAVGYDTSTHGFSFTKETGVYTTFLHLADNTTVFQIGANQGEDMGVNIGDMSARALGILGVLVTDRESAARSITMIDNAINKVSTQRAKLGAYQNRLEHTINNLTTASTNLKSSESRIRDADMAKEMMEFTKLNILSQAGNSMLAQANQLPSNVLALLR